MSKSKNKNYLHRAKGIIIKIIGLGGGGSSIVTEISRQLKEANFLIADTDKVNLKRVATANVEIFSFGGEETRGLGTGMNVVLAKNLANQEKDKISNLFKSADFLVLISCLGGGVGSGALPIFAQAAEKSGALTLGIFTLPFEFEGSRRRQIAQKAIKEAEKYLDALMIISNEKIFSVVNEQTSFTKSLSAINQDLVKNLKMLLETIHLPGLINIDFADLKTILKGKEKNIFFNTIVAEGDDRLKKIQELIIRHPFLDNDLSGVRKILFNIIGGPDLQMAEVEEISAGIKKLNPLAKIIFGLSRRNNFDEKIEIFLVAMTEKEGKIKLRERKSIKKNQKVKKERRKRGRNKKEKDSSERKEAKKVKVIRRSALDIKRMNKDTEFQKTSKEKKWDIPTFLRQK